MKLGIDILGNVALLKFDKNAKVSEKKKIALDFLEMHKSVTTVLEKTGKFSGRLRTQKTKWLAGEKTKEVLYKENNCIFRFNVDSCYFSPRLSEERKEIAGKVKKKEDVLVMFSGVGPFPIVIAKISKCKKVVAVELGRECNKYAKINVKRNKLDNIIIVQGDVRKLQLLGKVLGVKRGNKIEKILSLNQDTRRAKLSGATKSKTVPSHREQENFIGFDRIVMARPNLKDSFLDVAFSVSKKGTIIHYYGFYLESDKKKMLEIIKDEAKKVKKKIRILRIKKAGDIGSRKFRYRVDFKVY